jgi:hypothetical protein
MIRPFKLVRLMKNGPQYEHAQYHVDIDLNQANIVKLYIVIVSNINMWMEV